MRYLRATLVCLASCALAAVLSGCGSTIMNTMAGSAPSVAAMGAEANGVAPNRWLYAQFSQAMDSSTINNQSVMVKDSNGRSVPGTVVYDANFDVAGFQPNPALQTNASYTFTVTTGAKNANGVGMQADYHYNFTTRAATDKSPIGVKSVTPASGATCVAASTLVTITFTEGAETSTLTSSNIVLTGPDKAVIPAKISYNVATAQATISPSAALPSGMITVTVSNVADAAGVAMPTPYSWSFSTGCSNGGGGGTPTTQYMAPLTTWQTQTSPLGSGQITVDTAGMVNLQIAGAPDSSTYDVQFCEAVNQLNSNLPTSCIEITKVTTSATGSANAMVKFPRSGNWAGDFEFLDRSGKLAYSTYLPNTPTAFTYSAVLLPVSDTNSGAADNGGGTQEPLSSGMVTATGGSATFTVNGGAVNAFFITNVSETNYIDSSGTYGLCAFTTDAHGNGRCTSSLNAAAGGDIFEVSPQSGGNGYIAGFAVPQ